MNTVRTNTSLVKRLVPVWHAMRSCPAKPQVAEPMNLEGSFKVNRAGRSLTMKEYQKLENTDYTKGGGNNVSIQFGLLGGFGRFGILGESPG